MLRFFSIASLAFGALAPLSAEAAASCGTASFYGGHGDGFAWRTMANGQPMNPSALTTAHPSLPLGSRVLVRNSVNGKSVKVTVTDRGPFYGGRIIDLSYGAFGRIANPEQGLARVCVSRV